MPNLSRELSKSIDKGNILQTLFGQLRRSRRSGDAFIHWFMIAPALAFYIPLAIIPIFMGLAYGFTDWSGVNREMTWIGFDNYIELADDEQFWSSLRITLKFVAFTVPSILIISLITASALNNKGWFTSLTKTAVLVPIALSSVAMGILFTFLTSPNLGLIAIIKGDSYDILSDPDGALFAIIIAYIWGSVGFHAFIFLAGLQAIPEELYEAARIDGAGLFVRFGRVTIPLLRETTILNLILIMINAFRSFGLVYTMTRGGPYRTTQVLSMFMYKQAFVSFRLGYGSAVAVVMFAIIAVVTFVQLRVTRAGRTQYY